MQALVRLTRVFSARTRIILSCISLLFVVGIVAVGVAESKWAETTVSKWVNVLGSNDELEGKALAVASTRSGSNSGSGSTGSGSGSPSTGSIDSSSPSILGVNTLEELMFKVSVPAVFSRDLTAPNVLYGVQ